MSSRNPYHSTKYENDLTLGGFKPQQITYKEPCHIAQTEEPWSRLYNTATLASTQRRAVHYRPQAENSSLDLHLNSIYDHQRNLFWDNNQIVYQKETVLGYRPFQTGATPETFCSMMSSARHKQLKTTFSF